MFDVALEYGYAFLGYPAIAKSVRETASTLRELVTTFDAENPEWEAYEKDKPAKARKTQEHRKKYRDLVEGESLLLMPHLAEGRVYVGTYAGFTFHETPTWEKKFKRRYHSAVPKDERVPDLIALASVCQTLNVDSWDPIPFVNVPAWIRAKCFGRSSAMWIRSMKGRSATEELEGMRIGETFRPTCWTSDVSEVGKRLLDMITPEPFEHLMVALLQLEHSEQTWLQVGGSGDGGVDGIGYNPDGRVSGLLQCKWQYDGTPVEAEQSSESPLHLAYLVEPKTARAEADNITFYDRKRIAALVIKHADKLPMAITLKVKRG